MKWQDIILGVGGFIFSISLLPSIFGEGKPEMLTSLLTATVLTVFAITYFSLKLRLAALSTILTAICWWVLLVQVIV